MNVHNVQLLFCLHILNKAIGLWCLCCFIACSCPAVISIRTLAFFCFSHNQFWFSSTNRCYIWLSWMMDLIVVVISITNYLALHATHVECTISGSDIGGTSRVLEQQGREWDGCDETGRMSSATRPRQYTRSEGGVSRAQSPPKL